MVGAIGWLQGLERRKKFSENLRSSTLTTLSTLTLSHSFMRVRLGEHNLRKFDGPEQLRSVSRIIPHPGYEARTHRHDIMLLRLFRPARLTPQVRPVALPTRCPLLGEDCVVSGWGLLSDNSPGATGSHKSQGEWKDGAEYRNSSKEWRGHGPKGLNILKVICSPQ